MKNYRLPILIGVLLFLVGFVATAQPGTAQAALTLNNFTGFETNGTDEALSVSGTVTFPASSPSPHSGDWSALFDASVEEYSAAIITGGSTDSDNDFILGFWINFSDKVPSGTTSFFVARDDSVGGLWNLQLQSDSDVELFDAAGASVVVATDPFDIDTWHLVEVRWQHSASGTIDVHVDSSSIISETGVDLTDGNAIGEDAADYRWTGDTGISFAIDDFYAYSGGTGTGDFLGNAEVFRYQGCRDPGDDGCDNSTAADASCAARSDSLSQGAWQDLGETPVSADGTEPGYTGATQGGSVITDDTQSGNNFRPGPSGDSNIDATSNIKGSKYLHRLRRTNGSGTTHTKCYGTSTSTVTLEVAYQYFSQIGDAAASITPDADEFFRFGFHKSSGGRSIFAEELWGFILHVPDAGAPRRIFHIDSIATHLAPLYAILFSQSGG